MKTHSTTTRIRARFARLAVGTVAAAVAAVSLAGAASAGSFDPAQADSLAGRPSVAVAGDFGSDGDVDGRDLLVWQGGNSPAASADFLTWQRNLGTGN